MSPSSRSNSLKPPATDESSLNDLYELFEKNWRPDASYLADFVAQHQLGESPPQLAELVRADLDRRYQIGLEVNLDRYFESFEVLCAHPALVADIGFEDYRARKSRGLDVHSDRWRQFHAIRRASWFDGLMQKEEPHRGTNRNAAVLPSATDTPQVGQRFGEFELLGMLGRGAFSEVFLATQPGLASRHIALKVVRRQFDEPAHLARLQHSGIVPLYSLHRIGNYSALCMPYCGAATLADWLTQDGDRSRRDGESLIRTIRNAENRLTERDSNHSASEPIASQIDPRNERQTAFAAIPRLMDGANRQLLLRLSSIKSKDFPLWFARKIASALAHAHDRNVVHGDLKPANILIRVDGEPSLIDFNLAQLGSEPDANWTGGTLPYMSPEQLSKLLGRRRHISASSDIFSLGMILYEILEGHRPFEAPVSAAESDLELAIERWRTPLPLISKNGSSGLKSIVSKCLAWEPSERYADAGHLLEDLDREASNLPLKHAPENFWTSRVSKYLRRNPRALVASAAVLGLLLLLLMSSLAGLWWDRSNRLASREALRRWEGESAQYLNLDQYLSSKEYSKAIEDVDETVRRLLGDSATGTGPDAKLRWLEPTVRERAKQEIADTLLISTSLAAKHLEKLTSQDRESLWRWLELEKQLSEAEPESGAAGYLRQLLQSSQPKFDPAAWEAALRSVDAKLRNDLDRLLLAKYFADTHRAAESLKSLENMAPRPEVEPFYWVNAGDTHLQLGQYDLARVAYGRAMLRARQNPVPFLRRAVVLERMGDFSAAASDYSDAIRLEPTAPQPYADRARVYEKLTRLIEALADLDQALSLAPNWNRLLLYRSRLRLQAGKTEEARQDYLKAMQQEPKTVEDWISRALAQLPRKPEAALADLQAAEKLEPRRAEVLQNMAHVLSEQLHRNPEAIEALDRLLAQEPYFQMARAGRCVLLARERKVELTLADIVFLEANLETLEPATLYQIGCAHALLVKQRPESAAEAIRYVALAQMRGYGADLLATDADLDHLRTLPKFQNLIDFTNLTSKTAGSAIPPAAK